MKTLELNQLEALEGGYKCFFAIPTFIVASSMLFYSPYAYGYTSGKVVACYLDDE